LEVEPDGMAATPTREKEPEVDLARPLVGQVARLTAGYDTWVHRSIAPRRASQVNAALAAEGDDAARRWPQSLRLFHSVFLESLSHIHWWVIPVFWGPIIVGLYVGAQQGAGLAPATAAGWALVGLFLWTLAEYLLHRFLFHYRPRGGLGRRVHFLSHGIHHLDPWDRTRLVFPPPAGVIIATGLFFLLWIPLDLGEALAAMAGLLTGYLVYDMTHYYTHHARPRTRWGKFLKAWHLAHHHKWPNRMFGVSQPLWDFVLRTGRPRAP
jgi:sterol desaturase/sphingolipid hydroxylase (fatty acid hydroxylase superfamily)